MRFCYCQAAVTLYFLLTLARVFDFVIKLKKLKWDLDDLVVGVLAEDFVVEEAVEAEAVEAEAVEDLTEVALVVDEELLIMVSYMYLTKVLFKTAD